MTKREYKWCMTCNNYEESHIESFKKLVSSNLKNKGVFGFESGNGGHTPHLQCAVVFKDRKSFKVVREALPGFHMEPMKAEPHQAFSYCLKGISDKNGPWTYDKPGPDYIGWHFGKFPAAQGKRTDCEKLQDCESMREVVKKATNLVQIQYMEKYFSYLEEPRTWNIKCYWYWGDTGCGKTWLANKLAPNAYVKSCNSKWFNKYDGHEDVILSDYRVDWFSYETLLNLLDEKKFMVECKGGFRYFKPKRIFITTPYSCWETWAEHTKEDLGQLYRRVNQFHFQRKFV